MRALRRYLFALPLLAADPTSRLAAQGTAASPAAPYRGTASLGERTLLIQIRGIETAEPRFQIAAPIGMDDSTSRPMLRDPRGDTLLVVIPRMGDTLRLAPRLEGDVLRGSVRQGERTGTLALRRVVELPLDVLELRGGDYRLDDGSLFSFSAPDNTFDSPTYIHFGTGWTGSLFAVDSAHFIAGPRRYDSDPVRLTVQFEPGDRILIAGADGRRWRGKRTVFFREQEVKFPTTGGVQLAGTFTVPTTPGPHPAVIMLHGSDPHYRFRGNVVTFFASRGLAVLSWDKRGNFGSGGSLQTATIDTMAADAESAIRWLRARPEVDPRRVGVWGISQGGWPASILAARDSSLAFVILHAGSSLTPAVQGDDEMRLQVQQRGGTQGELDTLLAYYHRHNDVLRGRATRESMDSLYRAWGGQGNRLIWSPAVTTSPRSRWLAGINDFDPVPYWSRARVPVLALFGEMDGYVPPETNVPVFRAAFARAGNRDTSIVVFKRANHRFEESSRRVTSDWVIGTRYLPEYYATMAAWLDRYATKKRKLTEVGTVGAPSHSDARLAVPVEFHTLSNGLRVVLSRDSSVPLARIGVYYAAGPRREPQGRGGFAHLFEHLMFEGSTQLGPGEFFSLVTGAGGRFGARTLYDFTKYNVTVPSNALDLILWAEADRMRGLRITQERLDAVRKTVKNEVRQQSFNRPYGRFVWIDIPELAQTRWENAHSIYGDSPDGSMADLDSATVADAETFYGTYYSPANAVLVVQGDIDPSHVLSQIERYFTSISARPVGAIAPVNEPAQAVEKRFTRVDPNAPRPAIAISYHLPARSDPAFWTIAIIDQILIEGRDSWMHRALVDEHNLAEAIYGGISTRHGSMYTVNGPNFWTAFAYHDKSRSPDSLLAVMDAQIARLQAAPVDSATLARAITKARADLYSELTANRNEGVVDMLGALTLFGDDPARINRLEAEFRSVTPQRVLSTARTYLRPENRTVLVLNPPEAK